MNINIKLITHVSKDIPIIISWIKEEWGDISVIHEITNSQPTKTSIPVYFGVYSGGELIGFVCITKDDIPDYKVSAPWVACLYVKFKFRRIGIGKKLLKHCMDFANTEQISNLLLFTNRVQELAKSLGWIQIDNLVIDNQNYSVFQYKFNFRSR